MIEEIFKTSKKIVNKRNISSILIYLMEEVGELATEVNIKNGHSFKEEGKDGITGEAIDVILCAADLIYVNNPNITKEEINSIIEKKLDKWKSKYS